MGVISSMVTAVAQQNALLSTVSVLFLLVVIAIRYYRSPWRNLPPGPRGLPLLGNIQQMIQPQQWVTFARLKEIYGPIFYLNVLGQPIIVLGSLKVAADLLDRRASIYSDRPRNIVASEMMTGGMFLIFTRFNDVWKRLRKATHEEFKKSVMSKYETTHVREAIILAENLLTNGKEWHWHFERAAASFIMSVVYGTPVHAPGDPTLAKINEFNGRLGTAAMPGTFLVEFFPWMQYMPARFAGWKRRVLKAFKEDSEMLQQLFERVRERKASGDDQRSMAASLMEDMERSQLSEVECSWLAGSMYGAATETTGSALSWWLLAMVAYPETQRRAQEEIDRIVGRDRLPAFSDMEDMPYVKAMVKETLRWGRMAPIGVPHRLIEDDWYNGYFLPKNSIVIANVWGINHDPTIFGEDVRRFNPGRYLDEKGQIAPAHADTKDESHVGYGFGRRICVGRHVANSGLFIYIATVLWAMNIERTKDESGNFVKLDVDGVVDRGLIIRPEPFDCNITPRSADVLALLEEGKDS